MSCMSCTLVDIVDSAYRRYGAGSTLTEEEVPAQVNHRTLSGRNNHPEHSIGDDAKAMVAGGGRTPGKTADMIELLWFKVSPRSEIAGMS